MLIHRRGAEDAEEMQIQLSMHWYLISATSAPPRLDLNFAIQEICWWHDSFHG
jgi:hypothetical protein